MGKSMGLPEHMVMKPASPQLYKGHKARDELPAGYPVIDEIFKRMDKNKHKRKMPESIK